MKNLKLDAMAEEPSMKGKAQYGSDLFSSATFYIANKIYL
jgi:hypothetical protein